MTVKLKTPSNGSVSLTPQDTAADVVLTVPSGGTGSQLALADSSGYTYSGGLAVSPQTGFKNRIINGDMRIDQRNNGASVTPTVSTYSVDRWAAYLSVASKFSVQQNAGAVTPPVGFTNYLGATSTSAYALAAGDFFGLSQVVEGFNTADLGWGTANAQSVTLSFWVRSSLTGTFSVSIRNYGSYNRGYAATYTINAANTWEYKTITIAGDTTGTWTGATNSGSLLFSWSLGAGSTYSFTANSWQSGNVIAATSATSVVGTNGATFYITGVQLEKGSVATPFEFRSIGQELALCQRYYQLASSATGVANNSTEVTLTFPFLVEMRATPTVGLTAALNITDTYFSDYVQSSPKVVITASRVTTRGINVSCGNYSGLTQGRPMIANMPTGGSFILSSEL